MVAHMVADMVANMVADIDVDNVPDMVTNMFKTRCIKPAMFENEVYWAEAV